MDNQDNVSQLNNEEPNIDELARISDSLDRMIRGVFVFPFQKLTGWLVNTLALAFSYIFDFLWKLIQGTTHIFKQAIVWLLWTLPQKIFRWLANSSSYMLRLGQVVLQVVTLVMITFVPLLVSLKWGRQFVWVIWASGAWCLMAIISAVWGLVYLKRGRWKIRQSMERLTNRLKFWRRNSASELVEK